MNRIEDVVGTQSWLDICGPGPEGAITRARRSLNERLLGSGFVDAYHGSMSALMTRLDTEQPSSRMTYIDSSAAARLMDSLQARTIDNAAWAQTVVEDVDPERAVALLS